PATARSSSARMVRAAEGRARRSRRSARKATNRETKASGCRSGSTTSIRSISIASRRASKSPGLPRTIRGTRERCTCGIPMDMSSESARRLKKRMDRFPAELDDLLNARGRRLLANAPQFEALKARHRTPIVFLEGVIDRGVARDCVRLLDETLYPLMRRMDRPIPREAVVDMTENYSEALTKTVRVRTATFNSRRSKVLDAAREIGLEQMMMSASFQRAAQAVTRAPLGSAAGGRQVICYQAGDRSEERR